MDNHTRWLTALHRVEERTGWTHHRNGCACEACEALDNAVDRELEDMAGEDCDAACGGSG